MEMCGQLHDLAALPPGKDPPVPIGYGAWFSPEARLDAVEKTEIMPLSEIEPLKQSLYRLSRETSYNSDY
jgi:hypothetical protein